MTRSHVWWISTAIVVAVGCTGEAGSPAKPKGDYTVSKETTYLTEPLRKDGFVNYVAALNQRSSQGVTPENNAAVLFWKALGPKEIAGQYREKYCRMLGIPPLPEKGDYFVDHDEYATRPKDGTLSKDAKPETASRSKTWDQIERATRRPWSRREFPLLAEWLAAQEKPLALVVAASKRPRWYDPLCADEGTPLVCVLLPGPQNSRYVTSALCARAMLRLGEGRPEEAWQDLLACHRLGRLLGQGPTLVNLLVAIAIEGMACSGDQALLQSTRFSAAQVETMRKDLDRLPPMPTIADKVDVAERFTYLDIAAVSARDGRKGLLEYERNTALLDFMDSKALKGTIASLARYSADTPLDWDVALRTGNARFDQIVAALRKPTRAARNAAIGKLEEDFRKIMRIATDTASLDRAMRGDRRKALSERLGQVLLVLFVPPEVALNDCSDRAAMTFELTRLGFALAAYRADRGTYPARLAELVPKYVGEVPEDIFSGSELHYQPDAKGYVLYSVGVNGKDDGAKTYEDCKKHKDKGWDDLVVRVPAPGK